MGTTERALGDVFLMTWNFKHEAACQACVPQMLLANSITQYHGRLVKHCSGIGYVPQHERLGSASRLAEGPVAQSKLQECFLQLVSWAHSSTLSFHKCWFIKRAVGLKWNFCSHSTLFLPRNSASGMHTWPFSLCTIANKHIASPWHVCLTLAHPHIVCHVA